MHDWLVDEANRRGYLGAWNADRPELPVEPRVTDEELAVGLLMPHADADARGWKLVVRMLQSGRLDSAKVRRLAHLERADALLHFLLAGLPESEHTAPIAELDDLARHPPRGYRGVSVQYDFARLVKRPATRGLRP